eukprot:scaffold2901_cov99-Isochrysis_galbana.AAC.3
MPVKTDPRRGHTQQTAASPGVPPHLESLERQPELPLAHAHECRKKRIARADGHLAPTAPLRNRIGTPGAASPSAAGTLIGDCAAQAEEATRGFQHQRPLARRRTPGPLGIAGKGGDGQADWLAEADDHRAGDVVPQAGGSAGPSPVPTPTTPEISGAARCRPASRCAQSRCWPSLAGIDPVATARAAVALPRSKHPVSSVVAVTEFGAMRARRISTSRASTWQGRARKRGVREAMVGGAEGEGCGAPTRPRVSVAGGPLHLLERLRFAQHAPHHARIGNHVRGGTRGRRTPRATDRAPYRYRTRPATPGRHPLSPRGRTPPDLSPILRFRAHPWPGRLGSC